jgi:hypothetical protein
VSVAPTLAAMAKVYRQSRTGGPKSPRFRAYVEHARREWGFAAYNPMAGRDAFDSVQRLLHIDAEEIARRSAESAALRCAFDGEITLALAVASTGMWTNRLATEVAQRTTGKRQAGRGLVLMWAGEEVTEELVRAESTAETVRTIWHERHGPVTSLGAVLRREGLAYALAGAPRDSPSDRDREAVEGALSLFGDSTTPSEMVSVLYGDPAAEQLGWPVFGIPDRAGYRWAIARAAREIRERGAERALREPWSMDEL